MAADRLCSLILLVLCLYQVSARDRLQAPKITYGPRNRTVGTGSHAVYVCKASGNPAPRIDWLLNGKRLDVAKGRYLIFKMPHGSVLRLPNIGMDDDRTTIVCVASNPLGNATAKAKLHVIDEMPAGFPVIEDAGVTKIRQKNEEATLNCKKSGKRPLRTEWYKDYLPINLSDPRYSVKPDGLYIKKVLEEDEGVYECMITNSLGTVSGQVMKVYVRENLLAALRFLSSQVRRFPPHFIPGLKKQVRVLPGSAVNLTCVAAGQPMPIIKWRQGRNLLMTAGSGKPHIGRYTLMLTDIRESGNFTCQATSSLGEVEHTVQVIVKELPKPPAVVYATHVEARSVSLRWPHSISPHVTSYTVFVKRMDIPSKDEVIIQRPNIKPDPDEKEYVHYTLTKLQANTRYQIQVASVSSIGRSHEYSPPVDVKTKELPPGSPPHSINAIALTTRTLKVSWYPPKEQNGEITTYKVYYTRNPNQAVNKWQKLQVNRNSKEGSNTRDTANINHLTSNATYYISVSALNSAGEGPISDHFPVKVTPGVPSRPRNFQAIVTGSDAIQLAWEPPEGSENPLNNRVIEYLLEYKIRGTHRFSTKSLPGDKKSFLLESLNANTNYIVRLKARTKDGYGVTAEASAQTNEYIPSAPPQNIKANPVGHNTIRICWFPPPVDRRNGNITTYKIRYRPLTNAGVVDGREQSVLVEATMPLGEQCKDISMLRPWSKYMLTVGSATMAGEGSKSNPVVAETMESVPKSPMIEKLEPHSSTSLRMVWKEPSESRGDIKYYTVEVYPLSESGQTEVTSVRPRTIVRNPIPGRPDLHETILKNLKPNTYYRVKLQAVTRIGRGDIASTPPVKTFGDIPSAPSNLVVTVKSRTIGKRNMPILFMTWTKPTITHGGIQLYRIRIRLVEPRDKIRLMLKPFEQNVSATDNRNSFSTTSLNTYFGVTYEVRIAALNSVDFGDEMTKRVTTEDSPPTASPMMLDVNDEQPHKVVLRWKKPQLEYQNGKILQFQVRHFQTTNRDATEMNVNTTLTSITVSNLNMNTQYSFMVRAWNSAGSGPWTNPVVHRTSKFPSPLPPTNIQMSRLSETELKVTWTLPNTNFQVKGFRLFYSDRDMPSDQSSWKQIDTGPIFFHTLTGLTPRTSYVVRISTINAKGDVGLWSGPVVARNIPRFTDLTVQSLQCRVISSSELLLSWESPKNVEGLQNFELTVLGRAKYTDNNGRLQQHDDGIRTIQIFYPRVANNGMFSRRLGRLNPNTNYRMSIQTVYRKNSVSRDTNRRVNTSCETMYAAPKVVRAPIPVTKEIRPRLVIGLELSRVNERNGKIQTYHLIVSPVDFANKLQISRMSTAELEKMVDFRGNPSGLTDIGANFGSSVSYNRIFAVIRMNSANLFSKSRSKTTFLIGDLRNTRPLARDVDYIAILRACVAGDRKELCRDSTQSSIFGSRHEPVGALGSKPDRNQGLQMVLLVGGPIVVALFLMICVIVWCFFRRRPKMQRDLRRHIPDQSLKQPLMGSPPPPPYQPMPTDPVEMRRLNYQTPDLLMAARSHADLAAPPEVDLRHCQTLDYRHRRNPGAQTSALTGTATGRKVTIGQIIRANSDAMMSHPPIPIGQFEAHVAGCRNNDNMKFSQEYESIDPGQQFTWEHSNLDVNKPKNRYANVIAYDHSRVVLQTIDGIPGSDYLNANYMDGYKKQNAYIATQGPLPETVGDFWRMVWEQRSSTIVMMTRLEERARVKCDLYWPQKGSETYDDCTLVTHMDSLELAYYTIRTFVLQRHGYPEKREVRQFQFTAWPDHGVPDHPTPLLMFLRRVRAANPPDAGPVVVHCSAGVGRTGAFIVIDAMLERIKQEKTVDVYGHVTCLRAQRNYTVQTEDQYIFIHDVLMEAVMCGNTEVPARNLKVHVQKLRQLEAAGRGQVTGMELEFRKIGLKPSNSPFLSANLPPNRLKNRLVNVLPYESTRVTLQPIRGVEGSDYINASFIDGYLSRRAYIATQAPLAETTEDFWRMLWEHNSTIVVMLTKLREMGRDKCHQYWPNARSARYQYFVVDPLSEYNMNNYILREFKVTDARDGQSRTIRQFQYTEWPEQGVPQSGESLIDFIGQVHKTKKQFGQDGPISVHCSAGVGRTGVFLTLAVVLDRMRYEGVADMFQTVKMLRTQRPAMVQTEDQYQFCYACAIEYLNSFDHYATDVR